MEWCLDKFATQESACWETVMLAVCHSPFYDQELAKRVAKTYLLGSTQVQDHCGARLQQGLQLLTYIFTSEFRTFQAFSVFP